jgi:hypothetical protein
LIGERDDDSSDAAILLEERVAGKAQIRFFRASVPEPAEELVLDGGRLPGTQCVRDQGHKPRPDCPAYLGQVPLGRTRQHGAADRGGECVVMPRQEARLARDGNGLRRRKELPNDSLEHV